jgi:hypothetical protein
VGLASGRYDALSGRYIDRTDDPDEILGRIKQGRSIPGGIA